MARLTREEKYKIQEGLVNGDSVAEIAEKINRTKSAVEKYKGEFLAVAESVVGGKPTEEPVEETGNDLDEAKAKIAELQAKIDAIQADNIEDAEYEIELLDDVILGTIHKLKLNGIPKEDAQFALHRVRKELKERIDDPARLAAMCIQKINVHSTMITEAVGGQKGVAIMTSAASQIIDEKKKYQGNKLPNNKCIFNPKTGKVV